MARPTGAALTREQVVAAGLAAVAAEGEAALGTASVARRLGIRPPSVYHHFAGNEALRYAVAVEGWKALVAALPEAPADPASALRGFAYAYRSFALGHAQLYRLMTRVPFDPTDPVLLAVTARAVETIGALGIPADQALHAIRGLRAAVHGFVDLELAGQVRLGVPADESFDWLVELGVRGLTASTRGP